MQYAQISFSGSASCFPASPPSVRLCGQHCSGKSESDLVAVMINGGNFEC